jgi:hypothetical protein
MENIELRWVERPFIIPNGQFGAGMTDTIKVLQYRKYYDSSAYAGLYDVHFPNSLQWSEWTDVPTTIE